MELASAFNAGPNVTDDNSANEAIPSGLTKVLHEVKEKDEKHQALVHALLPYLNPRHQKKLQRAVQAVRLSYLAGTALQNEPQGTGNEEGGL